MARRRSGVVSPRCPACWVEEDDGAPAAEDLVGALGSFARADGLAGCRIENRERRPVAERDEDAVALGNQPPGQLGREAGPPRADLGQVLALERFSLPLAPAPLRQGALPQLDAVEGVACHERPRAGQPFVDDADEPFVEDVEHTPAGGDQGADARFGLVASEPQRLGHPLHVAGRADEGIVGHGVIGGVVEEVRPGLDGGGPRPGGPDVRRAARRQDAPHLVHGGLAEVFRHEEVDEVVGVGQALAGPMLDRHLAVESEVADVLAGRGKVGGVAGQAMHEVSVIGAQGGREFPVAAAEMHDQAALDAGGFEDLPGVRIGGQGDRRGHRHRGQAQHNRAASLVSEKAHGFPPRCALHSGRHDGASLQGCQAGRRRSGRSRHRSEGRAEAGQPGRCCAAAFFAGNVPWAGGCGEITAARHDCTCSAPRKGVK